MLIPQVSAMHRPASFRGVAGAELEVSGASVFLRVSLSRLTGSASFRQVEGSSELAFLALEWWTHGVIPETESSIWLYVCKVHLQVFERGGFLVTVRSGLGKIWFAYLQIHSSCLNNHMPMGSYYYPHRITSIEDCLYMKYCDNFLKLISSCLV